MSHGFDEVTVAELRARGSLKWTLHEDSLGAWVAESDFGTAAPILEALHAGVDSLNFGYLPPRLIGEMQRACAEFQDRRHGWAVPAERIHPVADVLEACKLAIQHFSAPGSKIILPTPAYMPFLPLPAALGRELITVPMVAQDGRFTFDLDGLDAAFRAGGNLLILVNPYNPLGRVFTPAELNAVCEVVDRHGGRVFADEIHAPLVYPGHRHVPYASLSDTAAGHTVTATSASKAWNLPGLKCAQLLISNDADAEVIAELGPNISHGAANLGVLANTAAYRAGESWLAEVLTYLDGNRRALAELLAEHLPEVGYTPPEGTYLGWLDFRELDLGDNPAEFFRDKAGVALTDGPACGAEGAGHARLNFATPRPILRQIVEAMAEATTHLPEKHHLP